MKPVAFTFIASTVAAASLSFGAEVVVGPGSPNGWSLHVTDGSGALETGSGTAEFVNGPNTPPLGTGSAHLATPALGGDQSAQLRGQALDGVPLAALTELKYSTFVSAWNGQQAPILNLYVDTSGGDSYNDRIWFEPAYSEDDAGNGNPFPQPHVTTGTWQQWNVLDGMVYNDGGPSGPGDNAITFAQYMAANPLAKIVDPGNGFGGIRLVSGFASSEDNFDANVDAFTIGVLGNETVYNFESNVPEPASLGLIGAGACALLARRRRTT